MPLFQYHAKKINGELLSGQVPARTKDEAIELLGRQGILPITIEECEVSGKSKEKGTGRISAKQRHVFTRQLANLLKAGIPLLRAIEIIREQTTNSSFLDLLESLQQDIREGRNFSDGLSRHSKVFSMLYVSMVRVGEEGGNLQEILLSLERHQKAQHEIASKVKTALVYPVFMAVIGLATVVFILTVVMPQIIALFANIGQDLPLPTRILIGVSEILRKGWFIVLPVLMLIVFSIIRWGQSTAGRRIIDDLKLRIPLIGALVKKVELARFCRTLELLLCSGIPLLRSLRVAVPIIGNAFMREDFSKCKDSLEAGESLAASFQSCRFIEPIVVQLVKVGEESGLLEDTLKDVADTYEQEVNDVMKIVTTILEPAMILIVGGVVGLVIMAMLLPIFQMDVLAR
ncbi:MAG: type II secretion system F family protein [Candidatus Aceula meridiana]|nr:type II secretion system F family protein [Candidatus Aceula meridiana]